MIQISNPGRKEKTELERKKYNELYNKIKIACEMLDIDYELYLNIYNDCISYIDYFEGEGYAFVQDDFGRIGVRLYVKDDKEIETDVIVKDIINELMYMINENKKNKIK